MVWLSMTTWQIDFYRRPFKDQTEQQLWELLICNSTGQFIYQALCPQSQANANWLVSQLQTAANGNLPQIIQVFRPQSLSLIEVAGQQLGIKVEATRRTDALKKLLQEKAQQYSQDGDAYNPLALDKPPPIPLPDNLWGEKWQFATLPAGDIEAAFAERPIPILKMPAAFLPINLGLASTVAVPGVIIYGGRQSMRLARWLQDADPVSLNYIMGDPAGLILEAGLIDRWVVATFEDQDVKVAAQMYQNRQQQSSGLHFLLVQPDDSGMTYSGFWLLQKEL
jgi:hypothetical protein